ncbi:hypothetical protein D3C86_1161090 [compost metagenome]
MPQAALGVADLEELIAVVVGVVHARAVGARVFQQIAALVVGVAVGVAVGVDMRDDILGVVPIEPFRQAVGMHDAIGVAQDVVVMLGDLPQGVGDVGQANLRVPAQTRIETAIVRPFPDGARHGAGAVPLQIHATAGAIGVAGDQMVLVLIVPLALVFVVGLYLVSQLVVLVMRQLALQFTAGDQPERGDSSVGVQLRAHVRMEVLVLVGNQIRQDTASTHPMLIVQGHPRAAAQADVGQAKTPSVPLIGRAPLVALGQGQLGLRDAHERQVFNRVIVELADLRQRIFVGPSVGGVIAQCLAVGARRLDIEACREFVDPTGAQHAFVVGRQVGTVSA